MNEVAKKIHLDIREIMLQMGVKTYPESIAPKPVESVRAG